MFNYWLSDFFYYLICTDVKFWRCQMRITVWRNSWCRIRSRLDRQYNGLCRRIILVNLALFVVFINISINVHHRRCSWMRVLVNVNKIDLVRMHIRCIEVLKGDRLAVGAMVPCWACPLPAPYRVRYHQFRVLPWTLETITRTYTNEPPTTDQSIIINYRQFPCKHMECCTGHSKSKCVHTTAHYPPTPFRTIYSKMMIIQTAWQIWASYE